MTRSDWATTAKAVRERDRHHCMNCRRSGDDVTLDAHHIVPRGQGGSDRMSNLVLLCRQCHDAAHGKAMAPRLKWYTNGQMSTDEFDIYLSLFNSLDVAKYDDDEECWFIPLADAEQMLDLADEEEEQLTERGAEATLAAYM